MHVPVALLAYCPTGHDPDDGEVDPAGHSAPAAHGPLQLEFVNPDAAPYRPAGHSPVQFTVDSPVVAPYTPIGHGEQVAAPASEYCPMGHTTAVADVEPAGH